jgi:hypothetical protein
MFLLISKQAAETALWEQTQSGLARIVDMSFIPDRTRGTPEINNSIDWISTWWCDIGWLLYRYVNFSEWRYPVLISS